MCEEQEEECQLCLAFRVYKPTDADCEDCINKNTCTSKRYRTEFAYNRYGAYYRAYDKSDKSENSVESELSEEE